MSSQILSTQSTVCTETTFSDADYPIVVHLVVLYSHQTDDEVILRVETKNDSFAEVLREVNRLRALSKVNGVSLYGYTIRESFQLSTPF